MMNHKRNFSKIIELSKIKTLNKQKRAFEVINELRDITHPINFSIIARKAGVSKSFLYKNEKIHDIIINLRMNQDVKKNENKPEEVIIQLRRKIKELEKEIEKRNKDEGWKERCSTLLEENRKLKKQLESAYKF